MKPGGRIHAITLVLDASDEATSAKFYREVLGFEGDEESAFLKRDGVEVYAALPCSLPGEKPREVKIQSVHFVVTDLKGLLAHMRQFSGRFNMGSWIEGLMRPRKHDGSFHVRDPAGNYLYFSSPEESVRTPGEMWVDPMNRDELLDLKQLPSAIGCSARFITALVRAGYALQYPVLHKTTPRHVLAALERVPAFEPAPYLKRGWQQLPKLFSGTDK